MTIDTRTLLSLARRFSAVVHPRRDWVLILIGSTLIVAFLLTLQAVRFLSLVAEQEQTASTGIEGSTLIESVTAAQEQIRVDRIHLEQAYKEPMFVDPSTAAP